MIVNTCSFIAAAREETLGVLREMAAGKTPGQKLVAAGCMAESHGALVGRCPAWMPPEHARVDADRRVW